MIPEVEGRGGRVDGDGGGGGCYKRTSGRSPPDLRVVPRGRRDLEKDASVVVVSPKGPNVFLSLQHPHRQETIHLFFVR